MKRENVADSPDASSAPMPLEPEALRELLKRVVQRVCPAWLAEQREDLVQDSCLRVVKIWRAGKEDQHLHTSYLWKVAHSSVMDEIRRRRQRRETELENPDLIQDSTGRGSPERARKAAVLRGGINDGVRQLKESRRWAVLLYLYGFSLQESAKMLGWNAKKVDNQRYQGLAELRAYLKERGLEP